MSAKTRRMSAATACALFLALLAAAGTAFAQEPTPTTGPELASATSGLEGALVSIEGEVISELLDGGEGHKWVNILSDGTGIGIWAPTSELADIEVLGDWNETGDIVRVVGTFHQGCDQHGGDLDIHATSVMLLERGVEHERPIYWWKLAVGLVAAVVAGALFRRMRRQGEGDLL